MKPPDLLLLFFYVVDAVHDVVSFLYDYKSFIFCAVKPLYSIILFLYIFLSVDKKVKIVDRQ